MQKAIVYLVYKIGTNLTRIVPVAALLIVLFILIRSTTLIDSVYYSQWDYDADRGAATVSNDIFGDTFTKVVYLNQGWTEADSRCFYSITQGSDLLPYDFFIALEQKDSEKYFNSAENMNDFRYLPRKKTKSNPDALPVGMVADTYKGKKYMGLTCAACHSAQVNHNGIGIRIDGGPSGADMGGFMHALAAAMLKTKTDGANKERFIEKVIQAGAYSNAKEVEDDLETYILRLDAYNIFNESLANKTTPVPYGFARLDAFGRIYNRVLEHVLNPEALRIALRGELRSDEVDALLKGLPAVLTSDHRDRIMAALMKLLPEKLPQLRDRLFN